MAKWNLDFYQGEDGYSDGSIEDEILAMVKSQKSIETILEEDDRWPILYHLSSRRENIFSWYSFNKQSNLLEIGGGCGALTGFFCDNVKAVTSVELTKKRSEINYERNKNKENLEIITGNFHNVKFKEKFDYIILNGVFEYAASFNNTKEPYVDFLKQLKNMLRPKGRVFIAIENRLGIKYFNGAKEDHTNELFSGLDNYKGIDFVKTFSETELKEVIYQAGFLQTEFYYPMPDYKFADTIYTSTNFKLANFNTGKGFDKNRFSFFDETQMMKSLVKEKVFGKFANSFLVEISNKKENINKDKILFAKISNYRKEAFSIQTIVLCEKGKKYVDKIGMNPESVAHIKKMLKHQGRSVESFRNIPLTPLEKGVRMEYLEGLTFEQRLLEFLEEKNLKEFEDTIKGFYALILKGASEEDYYSEEFKNVFGNAEVKRTFQCKKDMNIDLIFSNIFIEKDKNIIIDYEWYFDFMIPVEFILWRSLRMLYTGNELVRRYYSYDGLFEVLGINKEGLEETFIAWESSFVNNYVGTNLYSGFKKKELKLKKELVEKTLNPDSLHSTLYIGDEEGFKEENTWVIEKKIVDDYFEIEYDLSVLDQKILGLRWDPCEELCQIKGLKAEINGKPLEMTALNPFYEENDLMYFTTADPIYLIKGKIEKDDKILIKGFIKKIKQEDLDLILKEISRKEREKSTKEKEEIKKKFEKEIDILQQLMEHYKKENELIKSSHSWKMTAPIRKIMNKVRK